MSAYEVMVLAPNTSPLDEFDDELDPPPVLLPLSVGAEVGVAVALGVGVGSLLCRGDSDGSELGVADGVELGDSDGVALGVAVGEPTITST